MRWEELFADLEARMEAEDRAQHDLDVADLIRGERAAVSLADRLRAHVGLPLTWQFVPAVGESAPVTAIVVDLGSDWVVVGRRQGLLVPLASVAWLGGLSRAAQPDDGPLARRLGFGVVLRGLARDRTPVAVRGSAGTVVGTLDRIAADHLDIAVHPVDEPRRAGAVRSVRTVPLGAVAAVEPLGEWGYEV